MSDANMLPGQEDTRDLQALIDAAHHRAQALYDENSALRRRVEELEREQAGAAAQRDAVAQLLRDVLAAPIREAKYGLEPHGGWPAWHERAREVRV